MTESGTMAGASSDFNEDWEDWDPSQGNFLHHMVAGSIAGITEHTVMYPMDTFKTYVQCMRECPEAVAGRRVMELVRGQGMLRLWRGVGTMFTGCVPAHALYFSVLEYCKVRSSTSRDGSKSVYEVHPSAEPFLTAALRGQARLTEGRTGCVSFILWYCCSCTTR
ncbi:conserved unknown protein [Ectocarpus siliculosus]|uniref:Uncharacterized protein n=1 Tax=Ectocarpus siliculosus TaxID=2880 RepID=D7G8Z0_ECTSI|nr:conserved unknown protein [Ectocarpus siliculosus]|eukprot:CBJ28151.1 conserved unknown protein [Ectocarpus siliculosus]